MQATQNKPGTVVGDQQIKHKETVDEIVHERWAHCHVNWTAVGVGALTAFSMVLLFGLIGVAVGAHLVGPEHRLVDLRAMGMGALLFSVAAAFISFVVAGWVAGKIAGILHSEPGMLHGAVTWLVTVPMFVVASGLGASTLFGGWYAGMSTTQSSATGANSPFVRPERPETGATATEVAAYREQQAEYNRNVRQWQEETPKATRNTAIALVTALLLGLIGCTVGGWWASGEPMNFSHHLTRKPLYYPAS